MKRRFEDILTCAQVMEAGTVTAAAKRLNLSKSVISKRISDLEAALHGCLRVTMPMSFGAMYLGPVIAKFAQALRVAVMKLPYASTAQAHSALRCYLVSQEPAVKSASHCSRDAGCYVRPPKCFAIKRALAELE